MMILRASVLIFGLTVSAVAAQSVQLGGSTQDVSQPVQITSDSLSVDQATNAASFVGNVVIIQGTMRLSAQKVDVTYTSDNAGIEKLTATGEVTFVRGDDVIEGNSGTYYVNEGIVDMEGDVLFTQGNSIISAGKMHLDLATNSAQMSGRVKTLLKGGN